jgi:hypothetical protein
MLIKQLSVTEPAHNSCIAYSLAQEAVREIAEILEFNYAILNRVVNQFSHGASLEF